MGRYVCHMCSMGRYVCHMCSILWEGMYVTCVVWEGAWCVAEEILDSALQCSPFGSIHIFTGYKF